MKIGITYDLKLEDLDPRNPVSPRNRVSDEAAGDLPDDLQEEFDCPVTIESIASVLRGLGHEVNKLGDGRELLERLLADPPDFVFNFAEGHGISPSRESRVPAVLEMLDIPYSGSDPLALAVALDKNCAKRLVGTTELATVPAGMVIPPDCHSRELPTAVGFRFPAIVKPAWEGSSKGIRSKCLVEREEDLPDVVETLRRQYRQPILVEEFIQGDELTIGIVGNHPAKVIGVMRVVPRQQTDHFVYSLEIKRDFRRLVEYQCPPPYTPDLLANIEAAALEVYRTLGCRDVARVDFRLSREGRLYFLEANPLPGLNPESSDLVILAGLAGWSYEQLIETILQAALQRCQLAIPAGIPG